MLACVFVGGGGAFVCLSVWWVGRCGAGEVERQAVVVWMQLHPSWDY